jgi:hypothetical protein
MKSFRQTSRGITIVTLLCFAAPQAEAIEVYGAGSAVTQLDDGLFVQARGGGGHARHGGGGHVAHRGNVHVANRHVSRNVNRNVNRNVSRNVNRNVNRSRHGGNWARPGGYWWPAGGAVAAGAALGFISAAAAASWAGAAPGPNLCWYYTNPSQQQGYWDACPGQSAKSLSGEEVCSERGIDAGSEAFSA